MKLNNVNIKNTILFLFLIFSFTVYSQDCELIDKPRDLLNKISEGIIKINSGDYYILQHEIIEKNKPLISMFFHFDRNKTTSTTPCVLIDLIFNSNSYDFIKNKLKSEYPIYEIDGYYRTGELNENENCVAFINKPNEKNFRVRITKYKYLSLINK